MSWRCSEGGCRHCSSRSRGRKYWRDWQPDNTKTGPAAARVTRCDRLPTGALHLPPHRQPLAHLGPCPSPPARPSPPTPPLQHWHLTRPPQYATTRSPPPPPPRARQRPPRRDAPPPGRGRAVPRAPASRRPPSPPPAASVQATGMGAGRGGDPSADRVGGGAGAASRCRNRNSAPQPCSSWHGGCLSYYIFIFL